MGRMPISVNGTATYACAQARKKMSHFDSLLTPVPSSNPSVS